VAVKFYVAFYSLFDHAFSSINVTREVDNSIMNWKDCERKSSFLNFRH
jgi:hypothetical protein